MNTRKLFRLSAGAAALTALIMPLAGCGGGSNNPNASGGTQGTGTGTNTPSVVVTGTVSVASNGTTTPLPPIAGDTVTIDGNPALSGVVSSNGTFSIPVPLADITGNDTFVVTSSAGEVLQTLPVSISTSPVTVTLPSVPGSPGNLTNPTVPNPPGNLNPVT